MNASAKVVKGGSKSKLLILAVNEINAKINRLLFWATLYVVSFGERSFVGVGTRVRNSFPSNSWQDVS